MIFPALLMILLSFTVFSFMKNMIKNGDDIHAYFFLALYIYTIFTQIGYVYYPELSYNICYYGLDSFYGYWAFMYLSFLSCFFFYKHNRNNRYKNIYFYSYSQINRQSWYYLLLFGLMIFCFYYFKSNPDKFGWGGSNNMGDTYFVILFRLFTVCTFILYTKVRQRIKIKQLILLIICLFVYSSITMAAGNRSTLLSLFIAFVFYELIPLNYIFKHQKIKLIIIGSLVYVFLQALIIITELRNFTNEIDFMTLISFNAEESAVAAKALSEEIIKQDYYAPSHTLFVAMHHNFIEPFQVLYSNLCNFFIGLKQPYLTETLVAIENGSQQRGVGWAFHLFTEGYCFAGWLGIIYNGIVWSFFLNLVIRISKNNNPVLSRIIYAYMASSIIGWTRTQSCIMLQSIWFTYIPFIIILGWAYGYKACISSK